MTKKPKPAGKSERPFLLSNDRKTKIYYNPKSTASIGRALQRLDAVNERIRQRQMRERPDMAGFLKHPYKPSRTRRRTL